MADRETAEKKEAKKDKKKKKSKAGLLLILLLLLLLVGLGLNFGRGGLGGLIPGGTSTATTQEQEQTPAEQEQPTPETKALDGGEKNGPYVIVVGEETITLDDEEVKLERLPEAVSKLPADAEIVVKNEHALVTQYSNVKKILDASGHTYSEETIEWNGYYK